jgi:protein SCO1/2
VRARAPAADGAAAGPIPGRGRNLYLWAFLLGVVVLTLMRPCLRRVPAPPPVQGVLPGFTFLDDAGRPFGPERLRGAVWIVHLFYIGCGADCAGTLQSLGEIRRAYADLGIDGIRVLSLSVDPQHDTPAALRAFETEQGEDPGRWLLATGATADIEAFAGRIYGPPPSGGPVPSGDTPLDAVARSGRLVLVDPEGGLRGIYASDASGIDEIYNRAQRVRDLYQRR